MSAPDPHAMTSTGRPSASFPWSASDLSLPSARTLSTATSPVGHQGGTDGPCVRKRKAALLVTVVGQWTCRVLDPASVRRTGAIGGRGSPVSPDHHTDHGHDDQCRNEVPNEAERLDHLVP